MKLRDVRMYAVAAVAAVSIGCQMAPRQEQAEQEQDEPAYEGWTQHYIGTMVLHSQTTNGNHTYMEGNPGVRLGDMDNDGDLDVIVQNPYGDMWWFENPLGQEDAPGARDPRVDIEQYDGN